MTSSPPSAIQLRDRFYANLPADARDALARIVAAGAASGEVYAAGGVVRDLLLGRATADADLVTTADAVEVVAAALPSTRATVHQRFRTATVGVAGVRIDVATARREWYARPGALPKVEPAGVDADLRRRDFTINAMALRLDGPATLLDPCGGRQDLEANLLRVLHDASFVDDATRIFRAFRYAARLGFAIEVHTAKLLAEGLRYVDTIGGERLRRELEMIIGEPPAARALEAAHRAGTLQAVHTALHWCDEKSHGLDEMSRLAPRIPLGFALIAAGAEADAAAGIVARLRLKRDQAAAVNGIASMRGVAAMLRRPQAKPSGVVALLERFPPASVAAFAVTAADPIARQLALRYLEEWRHVRPALRGNDLIEMGVPAGPQVSRGLQLIRAARLDGMADDRADERALAARFAKSIRDAAARTPEIQLYDT